MAITRAQIARELYIKGGVVNPDGRRGFGGGADMGGEPGDSRAANTGISGGYQGGPKGGYGDAGSDDKPSQEVRDREKRKYEQQFTSTGTGTDAKAKAEAKAKEKRKTIRERLNDFNLKKRRDYINRILSQRQKKISAGLFDVEDMPGVDLMETEDYFGFAPSITKFGPKEKGGTGKYSQQFIDDVVSKKRQPPEFFSKIDVGDTTGLTQKGVAAVANFLGKRMAGPVTKEELERLDKEKKAIMDIDPSKTTIEEMMEIYEPNRFKLLNPEPGGDGPQPLDPCKGPNPPAYCFVGIRSVEPKVEEYVNPLSLLTPRIAGTRFLGTELEDEEDIEFAADGGRIGFKGGADMGTVSGATRAATAKSVNVSPGGNVTTSRDRGPDRPDDRSSFEQTVNQRNVINRARTPESSGIEKLYRTGSELNFLRNLAIGNFPGLGKQLMFELGKKKFLDNQAMLDTEDDNMQMAELSQKQLDFLNSPKIQRDLKEFGREPKAVFDMLPDYEEGGFFKKDQQPTTPEEFNQYLDSINVPRMKVAGGGIADMDREAFLLGGIAKGLKKAVRGVKKLAKSPIGKAALVGAGFGLAGMGPMANLFSSGKGLAFKQLLLGGKTLPPSMGFKSKGLLGLIKANPMESILGASLLSGLMTSKQDDNEFDLAKYYASGQTGDVEPYARIAGSKFDFYGKRLAADGGRIEYQEGGDAEPVAKKTMPLLDMDGKEKDYRETGGFVDMGRMERADDVPARLSKNEFVFTADAVRNAGEGDIDKGAEVMYNMMKNLEAGGEVSEESQGLEGAREMFQTSQRLGEVI